MRKTNHHKYSLFKEQRYIIFLLLTIGGLMTCLSTDASSGFVKLKEGFITPPKDATCGVYWYFMDGNYSKEGITQDLESMVKQGIYHAIILEVQQNGIPLGNCKMLTKEWKDMYKHIVNECVRLGVRLTLGIGPGWTGSGGPWVNANESMKHLVAEHVVIDGGRLQSVVLPKPQPKSPFFSLHQFPNNLKAKRQEYYEDVAVLTFPLLSTKDISLISTDESALYYRAPFSSKPNVPRYLQFNPDSILNATTVPTGQIINLTKYLNGDSLKWNFPDGKWCVVRMGVRNNGAITRPAPVTGLGFECDKMDTTAIGNHLNNYLDEIFTYVEFDKRTNKDSGGIVAVHMDSWEMGSQNWTKNFRKEFIARRGYDPLPYYLAYNGFVIGNADFTQRFLWDTRQTIQETIFKNHVNYIKEYAHKKGLYLSIEPYDMNPTSDLEFGNLADIPMGEFWTKERGFNTTFSIFEATSLAHVKGISIVQAEAFTSSKDGWDTYPGNMKNQADWALAAGINRMFFHTFQHQSFGDKIRPGVTMGHHGTHWNRLQTWWNMSGAFHEYLSRCQFMLQQGNAVSDILYLTPENNPYVFCPPHSSVTEDKWLPDKKSYGFDAIPPSLLYESTVKNGKICTKGSCYEILVMPNTEIMTPKLLKKIKKLIEEGATVVGLPPRQSPSLENYPDADKQIKILTQEIWGKANHSNHLTTHSIGKGTLYTGNVLKVNEDMQYPNYQILSDILQKKGIQKDFEDSEGKIRYIHRRTESEDIYFVANRTPEKKLIRCSFRNNKKVPSVWNPVTTDMTDIPYEVSEDGIITLSLFFHEYQSFFVVFHSPMTDTTKKKKHLTNSKIKNRINLDKNWTITFDSITGNSIQLHADSLFNWTTHNNPIIKYFSGTAIYEKTYKHKFTDDTKATLSLGSIGIMAKVWINDQLAGTIWTAPFKLDISNLLKEGTNKIKIELANTWRNRMIGDSFYPNDWKDHTHWPEWLLKGANKPMSEKATFTTYSPYKQTDSLMPSGLIGPVELIITE